MIKTVSIIPGNSCILPIENIETIVDMDSWKTIANLRRPNGYPHYILAGEINDETKCIVCTKTGYAYPSTFRQTVLKGRIDRAESIESEE